MRVVSVVQLRMPPRRLSELPPTHEKLRDVLLRKGDLPGGEAAPVYVAHIDGKPALVALVGDRIVLVRPGLGGRIALPVSEVSRATAAGPRLDIEVNGHVWATHLDTSEDASALADALVGAGAGRGQPPQPAPKATDSVIIVTTNDVPGYEIVDVHGDVFGLIVRARDMFSNIGASLRTIVGGEVGGYTRLLADSRNDARERLAQEALDRGANAVIAMRFDCNEIGDIMSEVAAYGTAVTIRRPEHRLSPAAGERQ